LVLNSILPAKEEGPGGPGRSASEVHYIKIRAISTRTFARARALAREHPRAPRVRARRKHVASLPPTAIRFLDARARVRTPTAHPHAIPLARARERRRSPSPGGPRRGTARRCVPPARASSWPLVPNRSKELAAAGILWEHRLAQNYSRTH
jgi:hypothetical protein